ncbi:unnamed protein product [Arctogadus glacialis]
MPLHSRNTTQLRRFNVAQVASTFQTDCRAVGRRGFYHSWVLVVMGGVGGTGRTESSGSCWAAYCLGLGQ